MNQYVFYLDYSSQLIIWLSVFIKALFIVFWIVLDSKKQKQNIENLIY